MHILADLQPVFNKYLFKTADKYDGIIINTFRLNKSLADHLLEQFKCTKLKSFVQVCLLMIKAMLFLQLWIVLGIRS